jgi:aminoglycoside/choline kinase family phosphotransferase
MAEIHDELLQLFSATLQEAQIATTLVNITALVPEASTRRYYRLQLTDGRTIVGVHEDATTAASNMPNVIAVQRFLHARGIAVPEIYFTDLAAGIMLQQDLGDLSLNQALRNEPTKWELYYQDAILHMLQWQRLADDGQCPAFRLSFDVEKLMFEFEFFITHTLLGYYRANVSDTERSEIRAAFLEIAEKLAAYPNKVFTHRDYHSKNIIVFENHTQYIIDFQDARLGLMQYDLCSLLCDAYAPLSPNQRARLMDFAFEQGKDVHRQSRGEFDHYFALSAFQRIVKAMGTFGRQAALGRDDFAAYLAPAWQMLHEICDEDVEFYRLAQKLANLKKGPGS